MHHLRGKEWYVVYSKPKKEEFAYFHLRLKEIDVFFPRLHLPESVKKRKRIIPLFPNYLFVRIQLSEAYYVVLWSPGVKRFVAFNDIPIPVDANIVRYLMQQANPEGIIAAGSNMKVGQEVQINGGPFDGLVGIIKALPDAKGRIRLFMDLLSRQANVEVPSRFVNSGWVASSQNKN